MIEKLKASRFILIIFAAALIIRIAAAVIIHYGLSPELRDRVIPPDARKTITTAHIVESWKNNSVYKKDLGTYPLYTYYTASIEFVMGDNPINVPIVNSLLGSLAVFFIYSTAKRIFSKNAAYAAAILYAFFPSLIFWSAQNLKDIPCIFIIAVSIWAIGKLMERFRPQHICIAGLTLVLLSGLNALRSHLFFFLIYGFILHYLVNIRKANYKKHIAYILLLFLFMSLSPQYQYLGILSDIPKYARKQIYKLSGHKEVLNMPRFSIAKDIEGINQMQESAALDADSSYAGRDLSSPKKMLKYLPKGMAYFLFAPFPWMAVGLMQKLTIPETLIWYFIFPFVLYGLYIYRSRWKAFFAILFFILIALTAYSLIEGNFGTAFRHRAVLMPFFFMFAGAGISEIPVRRLRRQPE